MAHNQHRSPAAVNPRLKPMLMCFFMKHHDIKGENNDISKVRVESRRDSCATGDNT